MSWVHAPWWYAHATAGEKLNEREMWGCVQSPNMSGQPVRQQYRNPRNTSRENGTSLPPHL